MMKSWNTKLLQMVICKTSIVHSVPFYAKAFAQLTWIIYWHSKEITQYQFNLPETQENY